MLSELLVELILGILTFITVMTKMILGYKLKIELKKLELEEKRLDTQNN